MGISPNMVIPGIGSKISRRRTHTIITSGCELCLLLSLQGMLKSWTDSIEEGRYPIHERRSRETDMKDVPLTG